MDLDIQVSRLQLLKQSFLNQKYEMEDKVAKYFPEKIRQQELLIRQYEEDIQKVKAHTPTGPGGHFRSCRSEIMFIQRKKKQAGDHRSL